MFTGLVEAQGALVRRQRRGPGFELSVRAPFTSYVLGESIAIDGVCLTVTAFDASGFDAELSLETAEKTTLGRLALGARLNLERALRAGDRLGGHLVSGHVDGRARCVERRDVGRALALGFEAPAGLERFIAAKGSVTLDGISLTVNAVTGRRFELMLIPHTQSVTSLGALQVGGEVNLEVDLVARYVARWLETGAPEAPAARGLTDALRAAGLLQDPDR